MNAPTTDYMDQITAEERNDRWVMCGDCFEWTRYNAMIRSVPKCGHCGSINVLLNTSITHRTFDAARAKKESKKAMTKAKRR